MARLYLLDYAAQPLILSVEDSVGRGGANRPLDVMLVQFFLNVTVQNNEKSWGWLIDRRFSKPNIDGMYGPITQDWIDRFQAHVNKVAAKNLKAWSIVADGRVDAIRNGISATSGGLPYTIYELNAHYYGTFGANSISRAADHPLMPRELARTFMMHGRSW
jgi:hypothetical protein